jgi:hypothetical protein
MGRSLMASEYNKVLDAFDRLGFFRGWIQEAEIRLNYRPDFNKTNPFE